MIRRISLFIYGCYAVTLFAFVALTAALTMVFVPGLARRRRTVRCAARALFALAGIPLRVQRIAPIGSHASIVVANHASYLDGMILAAVLPPQFSFVIKREITRVPIAHFLLRRIGAKFVNRFEVAQGASDARDLLRHTEAGNSLALFPEGTFVREPGLRPFRNGAFAAAIRNGLPVVPIAINGSRDVLPARTRLPRPGALDLTVFPAILPTGGGREALYALREASREVLLRGVDEPDLRDSPVLGRKKQQAPAWAPETAA